MFSSLYSYRKTHHNIVEFWHKTNFLDKIEVDSIELRNNKEDVLYKYQYFSNKKSKFKSMSNTVADGGNYKIKVNNPISIKKIQNIKNNMQKTFQDFVIINAILYNKANNFHHLELFGIGFSTITSDDNNGITLSGWFAKEII